MKNKLIILSSVLLMLAVLFFILRDFFFPVSEPDNPYEYNLSAYKATESGIKCYSETLQIKPITERLFGVATDDEDNIYVAGEKKVLVFDLSGTFVDEFEIGNNAYCLTIGESGNIYMGMPDHIEVWGIQGNMLKKWPSITDTSIITSIAINEGSVFVADAGTKLVYHYNRDGEILNTIGKKDPEKGIPGFIIPSPYFDLLIGREGELWVVNSGLHQLEAYKPDGRFLSTWKRSSMQLDGFSGCCNPSHISLLADGSFVTSEKGIERVKIHMPSGEFKCLVAGPNEFTSGTKDLDLAVDSEDRIIVMDPYRGLIRVFEKTEDE